MQIITANDYGNIQNNCFSEHLINIVPMYMTNFEITPLLLSLIFPSHTHTQTSESLYTNQVQRQLHFPFTINRATK